MLWRNNLSVLKLQSLESSLDIVTQYLMTFWQSPPIIIQLTWLILKTSGSVWLVYRFLLKPFANISNAFALLSTRQLHTNSMALICTMQSARSHMKNSLTRSVVYICGAESAAYSKHSIDVWQLKSRVSIIEVELSIRRPSARCLLLTRSFLLQNLAGVRRV